MRALRFFTFALLISFASSQAMSEKQLKAASKMIKNVCQPKSKVSNDEINAIHRGEFADNKAIKCYTECCLRMGKLMKNGKFDLQYVIAQAPTLPEGRRQASVESATACQDAATSPDKCEAAFEIYKCIYLHNPTNFFLP